MEAILIIYLIIGFLIAVQKKEEVRSNKTTGAERALWTIAWPVMYIIEFGEWVMSIYQDDDED